ncbi:MAG: T9SS type A sorting domain-containing protein [Sporocytophaga sp.]|nr:T9SS type A sorting domain-containing protein [Sporocytophaga sp.]
MKYNLPFFILLIVSFVLPFMSHAADYYWVGGTGKWSDYQKHWATTSGGTTFHSIVPSAFDNVIFDSNSHTDTFQVTLDQTVITCNNLSFDIDESIMILSGAIGSNFNIYSSIKFHPNLIIDYLGNFVMKSATTGNIIAQRGAGFINNKTGNFILDSPTGEWQILDSLNAYSLVLLNGTLNAAGKKIRLYEFTSNNSNVRSINFLNTKARIDRCIISGKNLTSDFSGSKITTLHIENRDSQLIVLDTVAVGVASLSTSTMYIQGTLKINTVYFDRAGGLVFQNTRVTIDKLISYAQNVSVKGQVLIKDSEFYNLKLFEVQDKAESIELEQTNLSGKNCANFLSIYGYGKIIKRSGVLNMSYVIVSGVEFTGGAVFNAFNSVDHGNTKGITISSASTATYYWIGGAGSWSDPAHWSLTSGGTSANCIPTSLDDVVFDEKSFAKDKDKVNFGTAVCKSIDFRNTKYFPVITGQISVYGSFFLKKGIDASELNRVVFLSAGLNNRIDFAKTNFKKEITFSCSGSYILEDSLQAGSFYFIAGTLNTNNKKVTCYNSFGPSSFSEAGPRKLILGTSTLKVIGYELNLSHSSLGPFLIEGGSSKLEFSGASILLGTNNTFNIVNIHSNALIFTTGTTIETLYLKKKCTLQGDQNTIKTLRLEAGQGLNIKGTTTQYINNIQVVNPSCIYTELSGLDGNPTISKASGTLNLDHMILKDISAAGGASFNAANSIDGGGNSGWNIQSSQDISFYWIGGNGNWSDTKKWSYTSGGKPANCVPSMQDNVIFDELSFFDFNQQVSFDVPAACKDMTWKDVRYYPSVKGGITINGSLTLDSAMYFYANVNFNAVVDSKVKTSGNRLQMANINAQKSIEFTDDFYAEHVMMYSGTISLNKNALYCGSHLQIGAGKPISLDISGSKVYVYYQIFIQNDSLNLNAENSDIYCYSGDVYSNFIVTQILSDPYSSNANRLELNNIHFLDGSIWDGWDAGVYLNLENCTVNRITTDTLVTFQINFYNSQIKEFYCKAEDLFLSQRNSIINKSILLSYKIRLYKSVKFDYLQLNPGSNITITPGDTLYVYDDLNAYGKPDFPIYLSSEMVGKQVNIFKPSGTLCLDYLHLKDIKASGGATFNAGLNSTNISNNTGWDFTTNCKYISVYADKPICPGEDIKLHSSVPAEEVVSWKGPDNFVSSLNDPVVYNAQPSQYGFYEMTHSGKKSMVYAAAEDLSGLARIYDYGNNLVAMTMRTDLSYSWYKDNMKLSDNGFSTMKYGAGVYYLEIMAPDGCMQRSNSITIKSFEAPPAMPDNLEATAISSSQIKLTWIDKSTNESGFVIEKLSMEFQEFEILDTVFSGTEYTDHFLNAGTSYTYRVYAYNATSHSDYAGPVSAVTFTVTGVEDKREKEFTIFPNPTTGNVQISAKDAQTIDHLRVYNDKGTIIYSLENVHSDHFQLNLNNMASGVYMIQITSESSTSNEKLIVK